MQFRNNMSSSISSSTSSGSFANWLAQRDETGSKSSTSSDATHGGGFWGMFNQFGAIRDTFASQFEGMSDSLPDAGALIAFRERLTYAIYLLLASLGFALLAVFVGLPTLMVRPSKFVLCLSLSTLLASGSVIVMKTPRSFFQSVLEGGAEQWGPIGLLAVAQLATIYVTVFIHKYVFVLTAAGFQVFCLVLYLATFIPGGTKGVQLLLRMMYMIVSTALKPVWFVARTVAMQCARSMFS